MADLTGASPTVVFITPGANDRIAARPEITLRFSMDMLPASMGDSNAVNRGLTLSQIDNDQPILLTYLGYDVYLKQLRVQPVTDLDSGKSYNLLVQSRTDGFLGANGRRLSAPRLHQFVVTERPLPNLTALSPPDGALLPPTALTFTVVAPVFTPSTGSLTTLAQFEMASQPFLDSADPGLWKGEASASGSTSIQVISIDPTLPAEGSVYHWRARLYSPPATSGDSSIYGPWLPVRSFYYGQRPNPEADTRRGLADISPAFTFRAVEDGATHQVTWPDLTFRFTQSVSGAFGLTLVSGSLVVGMSPITLTRVKVDGGLPQDVPGTWTALDGKTLQFTPTESIIPNQRYTIKASAAIVSDTGSYLEGPFETYFTSKYNPLYAYPPQVMALLGTFASIFPEDLIYFQLYQASLEANFQGYYSFGVSLDPLFIFHGPQLDQLQTTDNDHYFAVQRWVTLEAARRLILTRTLERSNPGEGQLKIADYSEMTNQAEMIGALRSLYKDLGAATARVRGLFLPASGKAAGPGKSVGLSPAIA